MLADIERARYIVSRKKSYFCQDKLEVVGFEISPKGRRPT